MGNDPRRRQDAEAAMQHQAAAAGITFDYDVLAQWQPVESQRILLWAGRFGLQEEFITAMNYRHFQRKQSASSRPTLLAAAEEVGLDVAAATAFLDSDELVRSLASLGRSLCQRITSSSAAVASGHMMVLRG
jgi:predicted DsbA family dithiol-disulfide isomerase